MTTVQTLTTTNRRTNAEETPEEVERAPRTRSGERSQRTRNSPQAPPPPEMPAGKPPPPPAGPTDGARDAFDANRAVAEMRQSPEYLEVKNEIELLERFERALDGWDRRYGGAFWTGLGDGLVDWGNIGAAADAGDSTAMLFCQYKRLFDEAANAGGLVSARGLHELIKTRRASLHAMEEQARQPPNARTNSDRPSQTGSTDARTTGSSNSTSGQSGSVSATDGERTSKEIENSVPRPPPSKLPGFEGATENIDNLIGWAEKEYERLSKLMLDAKNPADERQIERLLTQLEQKMQRWTALQRQLLTMISDLSKMYSDIAMNAIRNMK